jgi:predicted DNA binding CopG/RHH family protein
LCKSRSATPVRRNAQAWSSKDLEAIQKRALEEGLPYQTLISGLLHKYASGRLKEV